jgi:predicted DNA-binding transcriptional regulator YafY
MRYHSFSSRRVKDYIVDPYRLFYAFGGIYLRAWVDEYMQIRTFAIERIKSVALLDQHFTPRREPHDPFRHSLGVSSALPERIEIEFDPRVTDYVREREWHSSQRLIDNSDGSLTLTLDVGNDHALRSWVLSFGSLARVVSPGSLADQILDELEAAREGYAPRMDFEGPGALFDDLDAQRRLPFARSS